jgi:membrane protein DedA with SNARE-associated domain
MPEELVFYVTKYGYLAIFVLVFLQEIGMPNPFPNELLLIFSGYLTYKGILTVPFVILTTVLADFLGTSILYFLFNSSGEFILRKKPKWIPLSSRILKMMNDKVTKHGLSGIFIFRLTPFTRGYASVISGLLQIKSKTFLGIALGSAFIWSLIYVTTGFLLGPYWNLFLQNLDNFKYILIAVLVIVLSAVLGTYFFRKRKKINSEIVIN